jgi:hypothetical protein
MFAALRKALVPANVIPVRLNAGSLRHRTCVGTIVAPLVREASARANDLVILRESDVGTSLNVTHSNFGVLNSASSHRRDRQKSVSPSEENLRLAWDYEWNTRQSKY